MISRPGWTCMTSMKDGSRGRGWTFDGNPLGPCRVQKHRLSSLCAHRSCTPAAERKESGQNVRLAHRPQAGVPFAAGYAFFRAYNVDTDNDASDYPGAIRGR